MFTPFVTMLVFANVMATAYALPWVFASPHKAL